MHMVTNLLKIYSQVYELFKELILEHHVTDSQLIVELSIIPGCDFTNLPDLYNSLSIRGFGVFLSSFNGNLSIVVYDSLNDSLL